MNQQPTRPSWDVTWMKVARSLTVRSLCVRDQVSAVIVDVHNRIVATGYNGPPAGFAHDDKRCSTWCPRATAPFTWEPADDTVEPITLPDVNEDEGVLVDPETGGYIIDPYLWFTSRGYVRVDQVSPCYDDCFASHAEINALSVCDRSTREGGTIYVTSHVCFQCAKVIANSGLGTVAVPTDVPRHPHRDPDRSYRFLERCGLTVVNV